MTSVLCTHWCKVAPARIPEGKSLCLGGGFVDGLMAKLIVANFVEENEDHFSDQEEADTRMLLHAANASATSPRIVIDSPDTDVAVLCVYHFSHINGITEMYFYTGTGDKKRFISLHGICHAMGKPMSDLILPLNALTGCDTTSAVGKLGKVKPRKLIHEKYKDFISISGIEITLEMMVGTLFSL